MLRDFLSEASDVRWCQISLGWSFGNALPTRDPIVGVLGQIAELWALMLLGYPLQRKLKMCQNYVNLHAIHIVLKPN